MKNFINLLGSPKHPLRGGGGVESVQRQKVNQFQHPYENYTMLKWGVPASHEASVKLFPEYLGTYGRYQIYGPFR